MGKKKSRKDYCNFPVSVLSDFMDKPTEVLNRIIQFDIGAFYFSELYKGRCGDWQEFKRKNWQYVKEDEVNCVNTYHFYCKGSYLGVSKKVIDNIKERVKSGEMSNEEKIYFLAYCAAKAWLGDKRVRKTNKFILFAYMNGRAHAYSNDEELRQECHPSILKFYTRRMLEKIRAALARSWGVLSYAPAHCRGFYITASFGDLAEFVGYIEGQHVAEKTSHGYFKQLSALRAKHADTGTETGTEPCK